MSWNDEPDQPAEEGAGDPHATGRIAFAEIVSRTLAGHLREQLIGALKSGSRVHHYQRDWILGRIRVEGDIVFGRLGFEARTQPAQAGSGTDFTLYDARHTFSSRLLAAGIPLLDVAAWMGHSLRAGSEQMNTTTRKYAHATGESRTAALRELEGFVRLVNRAQKRQETA